MKHILFTGGGTLGPVTPLIAVAKKMREADPDLGIVWAGTDYGPERELIEAEGFLFYTVPIAKLPRYASLKLLTIPFDYYRALKSASRILDAYPPKAVISAGGFTAVPVIREAASRNISCIAHQLDYTPILSNRLVVKHCRYVTTSFDYPRAPFGAKVVSYQIPTPVRFSIEDLPSRESACRYFGLDPNRPVLLVTGGGTGAVQLNRAIARIEPALPLELQFIHLMGKGKRFSIPSGRFGYVSFEFLADQMVTALAASDIVVSRAGFGAISELAALKKPSILVPLPNSPQAVNAYALGDTVITEDTNQRDWEEQLGQDIVDLVYDPERRTALGEALYDRIPTDGGEVLANLIFSVMK